MSSSLRACFGARVLPHADDDDGVGGDRVLHFADDAGVEGGNFFTDCRVDAGFIEDAAGHFFLQVGHTIEEGDPSA